MPAHFPVTLCERYQRFIQHRNRHPADNVTYDLTAITPHRGSEKNYHRVK